MIIIDQCFPQSHWIVIEQGTIERMSLALTVVVMTTWSMTTHYLLNNRLLTEPENCNRWQISFSSRAPASESVIVTFVIGMLNRFWLTPRPFERKWNMVNVNCVSQHFSLHWTVPTFYSSFYLHSTEVLNFNHWKVFGLILLRWLWGISCHSWKYSLGIFPQ